MQIEILYRPSYSLAKIDLEGGEEVRVEGGSMVSMSDGIDLETGATGGLWRSLGRSLFGTTPGGSRASSVANTPVQTPRYSNLNPSGNSSASMVFNGTHHSQRIEELPSSYESNVNLYNTNDHSISEENPAGLTSHIRNESNGEMEEPFE